MGRRRLIRGHRARSAVRVVVAQHHRQHATEYARHHEDDQCNAVIRLGARHRAAASQQAFPFARRKATDRPDAAQGLSPASSSLAPTCRGAPVGGVASPRPRTAAANANPAAAPAHDPARASTSRRSRGAPRIRRFRRDDTVGDFITNAPGSNGGTGAGPRSRAPLHCGHVPAEAHRPRHAPRLQLAARAGRRRWQRALAGQARPGRARSRAAQAHGPELPRA